MNLPFVSCLMPTFNRFPYYRHLVDEAVECFVRQTYPAEARELVIWNDCPDQTLNIDEEAYRNIRIINTPRFRSLGEKRNALVGISHGHVLLPWDDDDISLPGRVSQAVDELCSVRPVGYDGPRVVHQSPQNSYWTPGGYWFDEGKGLVVPNTVGYCHNCSAFTRKFFDQIKGYRHVSGDEDARWHSETLREIHTDVSNYVRGKPNDPGHWTYVYRWNVSPRHLSGVSDCNGHYVGIGKEQVNCGNYQIFPSWRRDYVGEVRAALDKINRGGATR